MKYLTPFTRGLRIYAPAVKSYIAQAAPLSDRQIDQLILLIDSGRNTYADFREALPILRSPILLIYLSNPPRNMMPAQMALDDTLGIHERYFHLDTPSKSLEFPCTFKQEDHFSLDVPGQNRLHELKKELHLLQLAEQSEASSSKSSNYAQLAIFVSIAGIIISVLLAAIPALL